MASSQPLPEKLSGYGLRGQPTASTSNRVNADSLGPDRALLAKKRQEREEAHQSRRSHGDASRRAATDEEKAEALRAMQDDAMDRDEALSRAASEKWSGDGEEDERSGSRRGAMFLTDVAARTHGLGGGCQASMAARVARNRHTNQRVGDSFL